MWRLLLLVSHHGHLLFVRRAGSYPFDALVRCYLVVKVVRRHPALEAGRDLLGGEHAASLRDGRCLDPFGVGIGDGEGLDLLVGVLLLDLLLELEGMVDRPSCIVTGFIRFLLLLPSR